MKKLTLVLSASLALFCVKSQAHPYASCVTNNAGNITFHLNESVTNGQVYVLFDSGSVSNVPAGIPNNGTNVPRGAYTFSLGAHTNYSINIFNVGNGNASQTSPTPTVGSNTNWQFFAPRGVGINRNPNSPYFGTIYVANGNAGGDTIRTGFTKGVYALYPDGADRFGYGITAMPPQGSGTDGVSVKWAGSTSFSVYRAFVGPDDMVYISDGGTATIGAGVWMLSPDLKTATPLFPYNGSAGGLGVYNSVMATIARGSYAAGTLDLYTIEWDRQPSQSVWWYPFYDSSTTPATPLTLPWDVNNFPNFLPSDGGCPDIYNYGQNNPNSYVSAGIGSVNGVTCDMYMGPNGRFYCCEPRNSWFSDPTLWVYDSVTNGLCLLYDSLHSVPTGTPEDFPMAQAVAVSDDNQYIVISTASLTNGTGSKVYYTTLNGPNGLPALPPVTMTINPSSSAANVTRGVAFDSADNFYTVNSFEDNLKAWTLGLTTLTVYSNDSTGTNGSFQMLQPGSQVSVTATTPLASQNHGSPTPGVFTLTRTGTASALSQPLTVNFSLSGTATQAPWTNPVPFTASSSTSVNFAANQTTATVTITPVADNVSRPTLTVTLNIQGSQVYSAVAPSSATVSIANTGPQTLTLAPTSFTSMYRGLGEDIVTASLTRWGDTNAAPYTVPSSSFTYGGTAVANVDYAALAQNYTGSPAQNGGPGVTLNPGDSSAIVMIGNPVATTGYVGDKTIVLGLNSGSGYTANTNTTSYTLLDNHYQNENVLWSDALSSGTDSTNWLVAFGGEGTYTVTYPNYNNDPVSTGQDFDVEFGYALANDGIGAPPNGASTALKCTVNKNGTNKKAGVCVYPMGVNFSGDYAIRFSMNLVHGTGGSTTEYTQFGFNHYGTNEAWWAGEAIIAGGVGNTNIDGLWYSISTDQGGATANTLVNDLMSMVGQPLPNTGWLSARPPQSEANYVNVFKHPVPYAGGPAGVGSPNSQLGGDTSAWTDVEIAQSNSIVTLSLNRVPIFVYTNKPTGQGGNTGGGVFTNGVPMLGHSDPFRSVGTGGATYYSNIRAVRLSSTGLAPRITNTQIVGNNVVITFTTTSQSDTTANFVVQSQSALLSSGNPWPDVSPAANITGGSGTFQATVPLSGSAQYYRIRHN